MLSAPALTPASLRAPADAAFLAHGPSALAAAALAAALREQHGVWGESAYARMLEALHAAAGQARAHAAPAPRAGPSRAAYAAPRRRAGPPPRAARACASATLRAKGPKGHPSVEPSLVLVPAQALTRSAPALRLSLHSRRRCRRAWRR